MPEEDAKEHTRAWIAAIQEEKAQEVREDAEQRARKWIAEFQQDILSDPNYTRALAEITGRPLTETVQAVHWALTEAAPAVEDIADCFVACVAPITAITDPSQIDDAMRAAVTLNVTRTYAELMDAYIGRIGANLTAWAHRNSLGEDGTN